MEVLRRSTYDALGLSSQRDLGFIPKGVISGLKDVGDWKTRCTAVETLHHAVLDISDAQQVLPCLPDTVQLLVGLMDDPNFKVGTSAIQIAGELVVKLGHGIGSQTGVLVAAAVERLQDSKAVVRGLTLKMLRRLMAAVRPQPVLDLLAARGSGHGSWRVREEVVNAHIMALLLFPPEQLDCLAACRHLLQAMADTRDGVRAVALEAMAVAHSRVGTTHLSALLTSLDAPAEARAQIKQRVTNHNLPTVGQEGLIEHIFEPPGSAASAAGDASSLGGRPGTGNWGSALLQGSGGSGALAVAPSGGSGSGKLPWDVPRPRSRQQATAAGGTIATAPSAGFDVAKLLTQGSGAGPAFGRPQPGELLRNSGGSGRLRVQLGSGASGSPSGGSQPPGGAILSYLEHGEKPWASSYQSGPAQGSPVHSTHTAATSQQHQRPSSGLRLGGRSGRTTFEDSTYEETADVRLRSSTHSSTEEGPAASGASFGGAPAPQQGWQAVGDVYDPPSPAAGRPRSRLLSHASCDPLRSSTSITGGYGQWDSEPASAGRAQADSGCSSPGAGRLPAPGSPGLLWCRTSLNGSSDGLLLSGELAAGRQEALSPSRRERLATLKARQQDKRATTSQGSGLGALVGLDGLNASLDEQSACLMAEICGAGSGAASPAASPSRESAGQWGEPLVPAARSPGGQQGSGSSGSGGSGSPFGGASGSRYAAAAVGLSSTLPSGGLPSPASAENVSAAGGLRSAISWPEVATAGVAGRAAGPGKGSGSGSGAISPGMGSPGGQAWAASPSCGPARTGSLASTPSNNRYGSSPSGPLAPTYSDPYDSESSSSGARHPSPSRQAPGGVMQFLGSARSRAEGASLPASGRSSPSTPQSPGTPSSRTRANSEDPVGDLSPLPHPEDRLRSIVSKLQECNLADKKQLDWQGQYEALLDARRIVRHHAELLRQPAALHELLLAVVPVVDQLRSQTVRVALLLIQEMFGTLGRALDRELDDVVPLLLKRAGEVSTAGRENFLGAEADKALADMGRAVSEPRAISSLLAAGVAHKSGNVRFKAAAHLDGIVSSGSQAVRASLVANWTLLEKLFRAAAALLDEGSFGTRVHGKRLLWQLARLVGNRADVDRLLGQLRPEALMKRAQEVVAAPDCPAATPPSRGAIVGSRGSARPSSQPDSPGGPGSPPAGMWSPSEQLMAPSPTSSRPADRTSSLPSGRGPPSPSASSGLRRGNSALSAVAADGWAAAQQQAPPQEAPNSPQQRRSKLQSMSNAADQAALAALSNGNCYDGSPRSSEPSSEYAGSGSGSGTAAVAAAGYGRVRRASGLGPGRTTSQAANLTAEVAEAVERLVGKLGSKDWKERLESLRSLEWLAPQLMAAPDNTMMSVSDCLAARLGDGNSKVLAQALETFIKITPLLGDKMATDLHSLFPALASNLNATAEKQRGLATAAVDTLVAAVDPALLLQPLAQQLGGGGGGSSQRSRALLVEKLAQVAVAAYGSKPAAVTRHAVPVAYALLGDGRSDVRAGAMQLAMGLGRVMGGALLDAAPNPSLQMKMQELVFGYGWQ